MEKIIKDKVAFFAQYWGYPRGKVTEFNKNVISKVGVQNIGYIGYLELKHLSQITDEDATEISNIISSTIINVDTGNEVIISIEEVKYDIEVLAFASYSTVDYLRSKGYLLPFRNYSIEDILKLGWANLIIEKEKLI